MRTWAIGLAVLAWSATAASAAEPFHYKWGAFGYAASNLRGADIDVQIEQVGTVWALVSTSHRLRQKPGAEPEPYDLVRYADSRTCPAIAVRIAMLAKLPWPAVELPPTPTKDGKLPVVRLGLDGSTDYLDVPVMFGRDGVMGSRVRVENYFEGPVVDWVSGALKAVEPCWSEQPPTF